MTNKINMVINLSILGLLIYMAIAIKKIEDKVFPDSNLMIPLMGYDNSKQELEYNIREFLNNVLEKAITEQENQ